ncbi:MAG: 2'-5' RNA ligase family protein [Candidatus Zixiibacteriota bacterium]
MKAIKLGVVSILEGEAYEETKIMWRLFEKKYDSKAIQNFPHPHLSFQGGISEDLKTVASKLEDLSSKINPFPITIGGIDTFEKPERVIFLSVTKTKILQSIHKKIDDLLQEYCSQAFRFCNPQDWTPHITLAQGDILPNHFRKAKKDLENYRPQHKLILHNICLVRWYDNGRKIRIHKKYVLG